MRDRESREGGMFVVEKEGQGGGEGDPEIVRLWCWTKEGRRGSGVAWLLDREIVRERATSVRGASTSEQQRASTKPTRFSEPNELFQCERRTARARLNGHERGVSSWTKQKKVLLSGRESGNGASRLQIFPLPDDPKPNERCA